MTPLPIDSVVPRVLDAFRRTRAVVVDAAPGAGKTTRVPSALLAAVPDGKKVLVLEPRRIAAKMAALRVASELGERPGETVGYAMRFEEAVGPSTRLVFMTEGVLTRRLLRDPTLRDTGAVVLDEVHERHLEGDLALALLLHLRAERRPDLPLVAMSATIEAERFAARLGGADIVRSEGRMFDVAIEHEARADGRELHLRVVSAVRRLVDEGLLGDVLVFLPGAAEIRASMDALGPLARTADLLVLPLHGSLSIEEQTRAIRPADRRKVVLATNVAESSLTIDGVVAVIDGGLANVASSSPWSGLPMLRKAPISKASAAQRAGRAGRTRPGRCLRLYTRGELDARPEHDAPEIARADLAAPLLLLCAAGVRDPAALPWVDAPPPAAVAAAEKLLSLLGAIDEQRRPTEVGRRMLDFPLHPRLARVVVEAEALGVGEDGAALAALLGERDLVAASFRDSGPRTAAQLGRDGATSDVLAALEAYRDAEGSYRGARDRGLAPARVAAVARAEKQIAAVLRRGARRDAPARDATAGLDADDRLRLALLMGYPDRVGRLRRPSNDTRRSEREILFAGGGLLEREAPEQPVGLDGARGRERRVERRPRDRRRRRGAAGWPHAGARRERRRGRLAARPLPRPHRRPHGRPLERGRLPRRGGAPPDVRGPRARGVRRPPRGQRARARVEGAPPRRPREGMAHVRRGGRDRPVPLAPAVRARPLPRRRPARDRRARDRRGARVAVRGSPQLHRAARRGPRRRREGPPRAAGRAQARRDRARGRRVARRPQGEGHVPRGRRAVRRVALAGLLRHARWPRGGDGPRADRAPPPRAEPPRRAGHDRPRRLLGAPLPRDRPRAAPQVPAPRVAR
jgi:hypothetical protein